MFEIHFFFHFFFHFREAFKALDADGDGVVSKEDLKKKLLQARKKTRKTKTETWVKVPWKTPCFQTSKNMNRKQQPV